MQHANETLILSPDILVDLLLFCNLIAGFLLAIDDESLPRILEHFVDQNTLI